MPLLVGSLRKASMMVMSMEARAFGPILSALRGSAPHVGEWRRGLRGDAGLVFAWYAAPALLCPYLLRAVGLSRWQARPGMMEATAASGPWPDVVAIRSLVLVKRAPASPRCVPPDDQAG